MRYLTAVNTVLLICIGAASGWLLYGQMVSVPCPAPDGTGYNQVVDMFRLGIQLSTQDPDRSDALIQTAIEHQSLYPQAVPEMWEIFRQHVDKMATDRDRAAALAIYLSSVTDAISCTDSVESMAPLWEVKKAVQKMERRVLEGWRRELDNHLECLVSDLKSRGLEALTGTSDAADSQDPNTKQAPPQQPAPEDLRRELEAFSQLAARFNVELPEKLDSLVNTIVATATEDIEKIEQDLETHCQTLLKGEKIKPAGLKSDSSGEAEAELVVCEQLWKRAENVQVKLQKVSAWSSLAPPRGDDDTTPVASLMQRLFKCQQNISKVQSLAYNLWALRAIYTASDSPAWYEHLGKIDVSHLHPYVHALYSSVLDSRRSAEQDPYARHIVNIILNKDKVSLEAF